MRVVPPFSQRDPKALRRISKHWATTRYLSRKPRALPLLHFDTSPPAWSRHKRYVGTLPPTSHPRRSIVVSHAGSPRVDDADGIANSTSTRRIRASHDPSRADDGWRTDRSSRFTFSGSYPRPSDWRRRCRLTKPAASPGAATAPCRNTRVFPDARVTSACSC